MPSSRPLMLALALALLGIGPCRRAIPDAGCRFAIAVECEATFQLWEPTLTAYFPSPAPASPEQRAFGETIRGFCNQLPPDLRRLVNKNLSTVMIIESAQAPSGLSAVEP